MKKLIELYKKTDSELSSLKGSKLMPGYFNKNIFRFFMGAIVLVILTLVWLSISSGSLVKIECNDVRGCDNPFYLCSDKDNAWNSDPRNYFNEVPCTNEKQWFISNESLYTIKTFDYMFVYGPKNWIVDYSEYMIYGLVVLAFLWNAAYYRVKYKSWKYNKDNHKEETHE